MKNSNLEKGIPWCVGPQLARPTVRGPSAQRHVERPFGGPFQMLMHSQILVYSYDALWRRWTVHKCAVGSDSIVVMSPPLD